MVPDNIIVSLLCVELDREASNITDSVSAALFSARGTQSEKDLGLLSDGVKELGTGQFSDFGVGDFKFSPGAGCLGMNDSAASSDTWFQEQHGIKTGPTVREYALG